MFRHLVALSIQCSAIAPRRTARSRHTGLRARLTRINLPLQSIVHRVRRRLVLCDEDEFNRHVRCVLERFLREVTALTQGVDGRLRTKELMDLKRAASAACEA